MTPEEYQRMLQRTRRVGGAGAYVQTAQPSTAQPSTAVPAAVGQQNTDANTRNMMMRSRGLGGANAWSGYVDPANNGAGQGVVQGTAGDAVVTAGEPQDTRTATGNVAANQQGQNTKVTQQQVQNAGAAAPITNVGQMAQANGLDAQAKAFAGRGTGVVNDWKTRQADAEAMLTITKDPKLSAMFAKGGAYADKAMEYARFYNGGSLKERLETLKPHIEDETQRVDREKREKRDRRLAGLAQMIGALGTLHAAASSRDGRAVQIGDVGGAVGKQQSEAQAQREKVIKQYSDYEKQHSELLKRYEDAAYRQDKADKDEAYRRDVLKQNAEKDEKLNEFRAANLELRREKQEAEKEIAGLKQQLAERKEGNRHSEATTKESNRHSEQENNERGRNERHADSEAGKNERAKQQGKKGGNSAGKPQNTGETQNTGDGGKRSTKRGERENNNKGKRDF